MIRKRTSCLKGTVVLAISAFIFLCFTGESKHGPRGARHGDGASEQTTLSDRLTGSRAEAGAGGAGAVAGDETNYVLVEEGKAVKKPLAESLAGEREHGLPNITLNREDVNVSKVKDDQEIQDIVSKIKKVNLDQIIYNEDLYGPLTNSSVVIAIQVHDRIKYLRQLIKSLSAANGIENCLLIFSHDVWEPKINDLIRSIDFAMVMQIFYPYSLQTHPSSFPGQSDRDCPRDAKQKQAVKLNCINKDWPDIYGHYREAKFTQTKHHWWWKGNWIFNKLNVTNNFTGYVLFLEEDHFMAPDFLHVFHMMREENKKLSNPANILSLGTYLKKFNLRVTAKQVEMTQWVSSTHNMGMAINRQEWSKLTACSKHFCEYDDYNWDWSLLYVSLNCLKEKLQVMMVKGPRVFHIGECGVHHKKADCESRQVMEKVKNILVSAQQFLFPQQLSIQTVPPRRKVKLKKSNGGWGDKRDHQLCLNITVPTF